MRKLNPRSSESCSLNNEDVILISDIVRGDGCEREVSFLLDPHAPGKRRKVVRCPEDLSFDEIVNNPDFVTFLNLRGVSLYLPALLAASLDKSKPEERRFCIAQALIWRLTEVETSEAILHLLGAKEIALLNSVLEFYKEDGILFKKERKKVDRLLSALARALEQDGNSGSATSNDE